MQLNLGGVCTPRDRSLHWHHELSSWKSLSVGSILGSQAVTLAIKYAAIGKYMTANHSALQTHCNKNRKSQIKSSRIPTHIRSNFSVACNPYTLSTCQSSHCMHQLSSCQSFGLPNHLKTVWQHLVQSSVLGLAPAVFFVFLLVVHGYHCHHGACFSRQQSIWVTTV